VNEAWQDHLERQITGRTPRQRLGEAEHKIFQLEEQVRQLIKRLDGHEDYTGFAAFKAPAAEGKL
jgi:hypothetical protein